ncbi:MAG: sporulation protein YqfD [Clostridia bacterium]|nr:sporulation protein YqfD [Clostridia bacterium]
MQNKWLFLFGYKRIQLDEAKSHRVLELFRKGNIIARVLPGGIFEISIFSFRRAKRLLGDNFVFIEQGEGGLFSCIPFLGKHPAIPIGVLAFFLMYFFLSLFVFDVRIEGNASLTSEEIVEELSDAGLYVGARWKNIAFPEIEGRMLATSENVAWLNIYRRGLVAYVSVREKEKVPDAIQKDGYANIVSAYDAVIEEITFKDGSPAVEVGQSVKKGELLISAFDQEGKPTYAKGEVYGRVYGTFSVFIPRTDTEIVRHEYVKVKKSIKFLNFSINIFEKYRNLPQDYVIIEDKRRIMLSKDKPLPITLMDTYACLEVKNEVIREDEELIALAKEAHESAMLSYLSSGEIIFVRTHGEFCEDGYRMVSEICMLIEIGTEVPLPVS